MATKTARKVRKRKPSPGPWYREERGNLTKIVDANHNTLAVLQTPMITMSSRVTNMERDNGEFMAAAPTMFEALRRIIHARDYFADHGELPPSEGMDLSNPDRCFDDWAADVAFEAIENLLVAKAKA
jgi:hypothetical protein